MLRDLITSSLYPLILKLLAYFFPLLVSCAVCFITCHLFLSSERHSAKEISIVDEGKREDVVVQVYSEANCSVYDDHIEVGCFLLKSETSKGIEGELQNDESESVVLSGKLKLGNGYGVSFEDVDSSEVDSIAEAMWNHYFGRYSKWHQSLSV